MSDPHREGHPHFRYRCLDEVKLGTFESPVILLSPASSTANTNGPDESEIGVTPLYLLPILDRRIPSSAHCIPIFYNGRPQYPGDNSGTPSFTCIKAAHRKPIESHISELPTLKIGLHTSQPSSGISIKIGIRNTK